MIFFVCSCKSEQQDGFVDKILKIAVTQLTAKNLKKGLPLGRFLFFDIYLRKNYKGQSTLLYLIACIIYEKAIISVLQVLSYQMAGI